ncbi:MAG: molybdenum cofactor biosynthesis protein MoaC [Flavipsychrobacter sp.]|nr:molybdenum cofactor biosynthesis protein MoaC [Flavipsychrobacter sp.]
MISKEHNSSAAPVLYGLVLAGGKSVRMGQDKSIMHWHGKEQRYYMADMLQSICTDVFISCRAEQVHEIDPAYKTLTDSYEGSGPLIAILSAFKEKPGAAWMVVACDLPLMDKDTLLYLLQNRNTDCIATTFESPFDKHPEPLITIWEPGSYEVLLAHMADGFKCPRKALIRNTERVRILIPPDPKALMNANTPEDAATAKELLSN